MQNCKTLLQQLTNLSSLHQQILIKTIKPAGKTILRASEFGNNPSTLRNSMLSRFTRKHKSHSSPNSREVIVGFLFYLTNLDDS
ncbi:histone h2b.8 [Nicotiana attenuata]|uniref:Histone h2b.8 n=1 Tax=Nicotiana attenuata TaxID=49451 RepID=A0A314LD63_NICAT|nr:histone h2b.8 [Nicotiana attenuata]